MLCSPLGPSSWKPWPSLGLHRARPADQRFNLPHPSFPTQAPKTQNENWWHDSREGYALAIPFDEPSLRRERLVEKSLQLGLMLGHQAGGRRSRRGAADIAGPGRGRTRVRQHPFEIRLDEGPAPHVLGLLLAPDHLGVLEPGE